MTSKPNLHISVMVKHEGRNIYQGTIKEIALSGMDDNMEEKLCYHAKFTHIDFNLLDKDRLQEYHSRYNLSSDYQDELPFYIAYKNLFSQLNEYQDKYNLIFICSNVDDWSWFKAYYDLSMTIDNKITHLLDSKSICFLSVIEIFALQNKMSVVEKGQYLTSLCKEEFRKSHLILYQSRLLCKRYLKHLQMIV